MSACHEETTVALGARAVDVFVVEALVCPDPLNHSREVHANAHERHPRHPRPSINDVVIVASRFVLDTGLRLVV